MWVRYSTTVSFVALLIAYAATLLVGWSFAEAVPWVNKDWQKALLADGLAAAIIAWPIWFVHWRWAKRDWQWGTPIPHQYLLFFTASGLGASVVIGAQLLGRVLRIAMGQGGTFADSHTFILGALWSVSVSLWIWLYHGRTWVHHRHDNEAKNPTTPSA